MEEIKLAEINMAIADWHYRNNRITFWISAVGSTMQTSYSYLLESPFKVHLN